MKCRHELAGMEIGESRSPYLNREGTHFDHPSFADMLHPFGSEASHPNLTSRNSSRSRASAYQCRFAIVEFPNATSLSFHDPCRCLMLHRGHDEDQCGVHCETK